MTKPCYHYVLMALAFLVVTLFSILTFPHILTRTSINYKIFNRTIFIQENKGNVCDSNIRFRPNAPRSEYNVQVNEKLRNCYIPETDSRSLASTLDFIWRHRWGPMYRHGCWAPTFSKIIRTNNTLVIDCPPSMQPKYGFRTRNSLLENYISPVNMGDHEWVYTQCSLPFYSEPVTRLHLHSRPLPEPSAAAKQKPNVVFLQFDALGRQAMYRRMPRSYSLLTAYSKSNSTPYTLSALRDAKGIEFRYLNVNGRNSEPNMRRVYCGSGNCQQTSLLNLYKQAGYATSLLESYSYQLPNYIPSKTVDRVLASNYFGEFGGDTVELYNNKGGCIKSTTWIADEMFSYLYDRFNAMRSGGWFSINNMVDPHTEDELVNYAVLDTAFHDFLLAANKSEALDNTILIILGDHGLHGHDWKELWREFDHRNPPLYILIGKNVKDSTSIMNYLKSNSDKLISHGDIYMTFARFAKSSLPLTLPKAINLFSENISNDRTCRTAGIPDEWCNCWQPKPC
ncbi:hypothetical protein I4U23_018881 [Adineta vaga]|nr:hypothetical protein I4U23_018881 [Adineta vaga]